MNGVGYAVETLRQEYYRIGLDIRRVPTEQWGYGYRPDNEERRQCEIVEALLILGADITSDMQALRDRIIAKEVSNAM